MFKQGSRIVWIAALATLLTGCIADAADSEEEAGDPGASPPEQTVMAVQKNESRASTSRQSVECRIPPHPIKVIAIQEESQ